MNVNSQNGFNLNAFVRERLDKGMKGDSLVQYSEVRELITDAEKELGRALEPRELGDLADVFKQESDKPFGVRADANVFKELAKLASNPQTKAYFAALQEQSSDPVIGAGEQVTTAKQRAALIEMLVKLTLHSDLWNFSIDGEKDKPPPAKSEVVDALIGGRTVTVAVGRGNVTLTRMGSVIELATFVRGELAERDSDRRDHRREAARVDRKIAEREARNAARDNRPLLERILFP